MPPRVAPQQVVVVPIPNAKMSEDQRQDMATRAQHFVQELQSAGVRVTSDTRDNYTPGWKYNHWELKVSVWALCFFFLSPRLLSSPPLLASSPCLLSLAPLPVSSHWLLSLSPLCISGT